MAGLPKSSSANDYDSFAGPYAESNATGAYNARYERPATLSLIGKADGVRILDAGCGPGALSEALAGRGAQVTGVDASAELLALASLRLNGRASFHQADLRGPLPFEDESFDLVVASLVMHYIEDWSPTLTEFRRVLTPTGRLVLSTHHPMMDHLLGGGDNYFATYEFTEDWVVGDVLMRMRFWHRPLRAMLQALSAAGFRVEEIDEPAPEDSVRTSDPAAWASLTTEPRFIFFSASVR
jgi:ubiquinone/menaquinone biosynthesis C-methylase UbiE